MRNQLQLLFLSMIIAFSGFTVINAQSNDWSYTGKINFPVKDSIAAKPYLCTLDKNGRLYVISSKVDDIMAHNAVYYADPGDTVFSEFIDYDSNGDSDTLKGNIGVLRGITTLNGDVIVIASQPYPKTKPNTLAATYYYKDADTNKVERFGWGIAGSGYGSYNNGADVSKDSMLIVGIDFGTTFRWFNFSNSYTKSARGSWNPPDTTNINIFSNAIEPGGPQTSGLDLIRDVALVPGGDYYNKNTVFYTSRNSLSSSQQTGGIAVWQGGTQVQPIDYSPNRITDFNGYLNFINYFPYGITVDVNGILWVAGVDSTRRWVKGFKVDGVNAEALYDLPSKNSLDVPDPNGAPMLGPSDVVLNSNAGTAYVVDRYARCAFIFKNNTVGVNDKHLAEFNFSLQQNYPNPFNPSTMIAFTLSRSSSVKLVITDMLGREVKTLVNGYMTAGKHIQIFNGKKLPSGIYFYTLITPSFKISKKMILLK